MDGMREKSQTELARESFSAMQCPMDGNPKRPRQDWFCRSCWFKLPRDIQNPLLYLRKDYLEQWAKAKKLLWEGEK